MPAAPDKPPPFQMVTTSQSSLAYPRLSAEAHISSEGSEGAMAMTVLALMGASVRHMHIPAIQLCQGQNLSALLRGMGYILWVLEI